MASAADHTKAAILRKAKLSDAGNWTGKSAGNALQGMRTWRKAMASAKLPPDWAEILNDIEGRLAAALEAIAPEEPAAPDVPAHPDREGAWQALCERLDGVAVRAGEAETLVRQTDLALEAAELALQTHASAAADVRQRLSASFEERSAPGSVNSAKKSLLAR
jgi:hypothetical protein